MIESEKWEEVGEEEEEKDTWLLLLWLLLLENGNIYIWFWLFNEVEGRRWWWGVGACKEKIGIIQLLMIGWVESRDCSGG